MTSVVLHLLCKMPRLSFWMPFWSDPTHASVHTLPDVDWPVVTDHTYGEVNKAPLGAKASWKPYFRSQEMMEMDRQVLYWFSGKDRAEQNETMRVLCLLGGRQKLQKLLVLFIYIYISRLKSRYTSSLLQKRKKKAFIIQFLSSVGSTFLCSHFRS